MKERIVYSAPKVCPVVLQPEGALLNLSNFGDNNAPGEGFGGGNILDNPTDF